MSFDVSMRLTLQGAQAVTSGLQQIEGKVAQVERAASQGAEGADRLSQALGRVVQLGAGGAGLAALAATTLGMSKAFFEASVNAERLRMGLGFATGNAADDIDYLRKLTQRLGLQFDTTASSYMKFAAAARQTSLEGSGARQVFESVSKAAAVMGLSAEQSEGALLALQQMISKGTVSAEELRGQLGERLPGAFQVAARSMGVTTQELGRMLEQGRVLSEDFLPRFARQLEQELGGAAEKAGDRLEASANRMSNAWAGLKQQIGDSGVSGFLAGQVNILTDAMDDAARSIRKARDEGGGFVAQALAAGGAALRFVNPINAVSYSAQEAGAQLKTAEAEMAKLRLRLEINPESFYLRNDIHQLQKFIDKLQEAQSLARMPLQTDAETRRLGLGVEANQSSAESARLGRSAGAFAGADARAKILQQYASDAARLQQELMRVRETFGGIIPPDVEQAIRARFIKPIKEAAQAAEQMGPAREQLVKWERDYYDEIIKREGFDQARFEREELEATARLQTADKLVAAIRRETEQLGMSNEERELSIALFDLESRGIERGTFAYEEYTEQLKKAIEERRKMRNQVMQRSEAETAARRAMEEYDRAAQELNRSLTDALMRAFESGKGFARAFRDTVANAFQTMVLRPIVQTVLQPLIQPITVITQAAASGVASAAGSMLGNAAAAAGMGSISGIGSIFSAGSAATMAGNGIGSSLSAAGNMMAGGQVAQGASFGAGAIAPYAAAAILGMYAGRAISNGYSIGGSGNATVNLLGVVGGAINRAFGRRPREVTDAGVTGTFGAGGSFTGQAFEDWLRKGGTFRSDKRGTDFRAIDAPLQEALDAGGKAILASAQAYAKTLGLPAEYMTSITSSARIKLTGNAEADTKAITDALNLYGDALTAFLKDRIEPLAKEGERTLDTLQRLAGIQQFSEAINGLGGVFSRVARLTFEAREQLGELAGGLDKFAAKALGFVQNYYGRDEIAGLKAGEIQGVLRELGITQDISSRDDFRRLVDGTDVSTEAGRQQLNALLDISGAFVDVADYLAETGQTLSQAAAGAPANSPLAAAFSQEPTVTAITNMGNVIVQGLEMVADVIRANGGTGGLFDFVRSRAASPPEVNGGVDTSGNAGGFGG